ncbi:hypothetical protein WP50_31445 [Lactiplantibacillus plantarum]|nr:hypothetical protein WP50_31445 [Lactiplantibacillus plantarum]
MNNQTFDASAYHQQYGLIADSSERTRTDTIINPAARVNRGVELASDLVEAPQSRIFQQMTNGVYIRMAMVARVLAHQGLISATQVEV